MIRLLKHEKFEVMTGGSASTFISQAILDRIKACDMFLCLMTRDELKVDSTYTTSPWLLQETGAAVALGKPLVLMVQDGVSGIGGLQADWQRIHFTDKTFLRAALDALQQLEFQSKRRRSHFAELATGSSKHGKAR
ncbi:MAG TPA: hypothetical protein VHA33_12530 [Candidatus Angelobacter sp.]|nr:hypothetical protein [Candidatus Angelobacter sp.]